MPIHCNLHIWFKTLGLLPLLAVGACSPLHVVNTVSHVYSAKVQHDVAFGSHTRQRMDIYEPEVPKLAKDGNPIVVMFIYGGSWNRGEKSDYAFVGRRLAALGYWVAIPNYRLYPEVQYPDFLIDNAKAIKALLGHVQNKHQVSNNAQNHLPNNITQRVVLMGHSAGAYNAAMLALDNRWLNAQNIQPNIIAGWIGYAGAYQIYPITDVEVQPVFHHPNYPVLSMPIDHVQASSPISAKTLLIAPESDDLISIERNTLAMHNALGAFSTLLTIKGTTHVSVLGTLSPILRFKGDWVSPVAQFIEACANTP